MTTPRNRGCENDQGVKIFLAIPEFLNQNRATPLNSALTFSARKEGLPCKRALRLTRPASRTLSTLSITALVIGMTLLALVGALAQSQIYDATPDFSCAH